MKYDPETRTLTFSSDHEVDELHRQLTLLLRHTLTEASKTVEDGTAARAISQSILKECAAVTRTINTLRRSMTPRAQR